MERPFHFVETSLLNGREFHSLEHLNEVTAQWLAEVADVRIHRETKRRPIDLHAEELPYLIPLPEESFDTAEVVYRTVNAEGMVAYRQTFYAVPWRYLGQVPALADHGIPQKSGKEPQMNAGKRGWLSPFIRVYQRLSAVFPSSLPACERLPSGPCSG